MISIIAAVTKNQAIGKNNKLLFHISADLKRFKDLTTGNTVVMGRRTFESLPNGALPNRRNIVVSRNKDFSAPDIEVVNSIADACQNDEGKLFIIGGAALYRETMNIASRLLLTEIDEIVCDADTFFPEINWNEWEIIEKSKWQFDDKYRVRYRFITAQRK